MLAPPDRPGPYTRPVTDAHGPSAEPSRHATRLAYAAVSFAAAFALVVQLGLWLLSAQTSADRVRIVFTYSTFFTNWTALAVAIVAGRLAWRFDGPFSRPPAATALAMCVTIVCTVYELALRRFWHPHGMVLVTDLLFHDAVPAGYLACWAAFVPKGTLRARDVRPWLAIPAVYGVWALGSGAVTGRFPYGFLSATELGWPAVLAIGAGLILLFGMVGLAFVGIDRWLGYKNRPDV